MTLVAGEEKKWCKKKCCRRENAMIGDKKIKKCMMLKKIFTGYLAFSFFLKEKAEWPVKEIYEESLKYI